MSVDRADARPHELTAFYGYEVDLRFAGQNHGTAGFDQAGSIRPASVSAFHVETTAMSITWQPGRFEIKTPTGTNHVNDLLGGPFGIRQEPRRWRLVWTVSHLATGMRVTLGNGAGFLDPALAKEFAERLLPLADWNVGRALADDQALSMKVVAIWNELITRDVATRPCAIYATSDQQIGGQRAARRRKLRTRAP